ncbi:hypothetical protein MRB53_011783 [Persea americana]|uniref:Uncharacterized protein n=1 Tax=Persea americana TaxID=3435 RepID=A0ACC2LVX8_PERAE|nr:hypothetical protein MRB53_011783 [Persea americana]
MPLQKEETESIFYDKFTPDGICFVNKSHLNASLPQCLLLRIHLPHYRGDLLPLPAVSTPASDYAIGPRDGHETTFGLKKSVDSEDGASPIESSISSSSMSPSSSSAIDFLTLCHRLKIVTK